MWQDLWQYAKMEVYELVEWSKCGESYTSAVPTAAWAAGAAALAHRLLGALFRRVLFRRTPWWEYMLQNLLFIWLVIYSLHFWAALVTIVKTVIEYIYGHEEDVIPVEGGQVSDGRKMMQQWVIWMVGVAPLAIYIHTRPRPQRQPLMIWITTSPWQRREMGPYGYYLNRPLSSLQSSTNISVRSQIMSLRKAFSDSKIIIKEPTKKKRYSKSV